jgi:thiaminase/transcriptional activator TenA
LDRPRDLEEQREKDHDAMTAKASVEITVAWQSPGCLWERLKAACTEDWERYLANEFIWHMADGTLPTSAYRHFIEQDYLYCLNFCRAYALAASKSRTAGELRRSVSRAAAILDGELELHRRLLAEWGLSLEEIESLPESSANIAYTRYLLDIGASGDLLDLHVALSICVVGYAEVGVLLLDHGRTKLEGNPYRSWIEQYADPEFQALADSVRDHLDQIAEGRLTLPRFAELVRIYRQTLRLDIGFWDMAFREQI